MIAGTRLESLAPRFVGEDVLPCFRGRVAQLFPETPALPRWRVCDQHEWDAKSAFPTIAVLDRAPNLAKRQGLSHGESMILGACAGYPRARAAVELAVKKTTHTASVRGCPCLPRPPSKRKPASS